MSLRTGLLLLGVLAVAATRPVPLRAADDAPASKPAARAEDRPASKGATRANDRPASEPATPRAEQRSEQDEIDIFLDVPSSIDELLRRLRNPDFRLMKEEAFRKRLESARPAGNAGDLPEAVVESVAVTGEVKGDLAELAVEYGISVAIANPVWVPIRLDDLNLVDVRDGDKVLPPHNVAGKGWQVELTGRGKHTVRVRLNVRLKSSADGSRLDFAIPEATSTRLDLEIPRKVLDAVAGANEPIVPQPIAGGARTRLVQAMTPRSRLDVSWHVEAEPQAQLPPLLSIQGEIAIDIDPDSFRTRSSWIIHAIRGVERSLVFRLDRNDEVLELELDGQPNPPAGIEGDDGARRLTINLSEPLRPGAPRKLMIATRRPLNAGATTRLSFVGFPLNNARGQNGMIGIVKNGSVWVQPEAGRGLRQVDPRELPSESLRVRPATLLAYQFSDQPFELKLQIEPYPPLVSTLSRTRIGLTARQARVETSIQYQTARGRLFDVTVALPKGLELESVGPPEFVESSKIVAEAADGARLLNVLLTSRARERNTFSLALAGRQAIDPSRPVAVDLFQPRGTTTGGGRVAVVGDRSLTVELPEGAPDGAGADEFRPTTSDPPSDWPWPADRSAAGTGEAVVLWLRHDGNPSNLPLRIGVHPRQTVHRTTLFVQPQRSRVDIRQESVSTVRFGSLSTLEILVPPALQAHWELDADEVAGREDLGLDPSGDRIVRLRFAREVNGKVRLKFVSRLPFARPLDSKAWSEVVIPWIRIRGGSTEPTQATFATDPAIELEEPGAGWEPLAADGASSSDGNKSLRRFTLSETDSQVAELRVRARARPVVALPSLVIPRLWIRTVQGPDDQLRTTARCWVESSDGTLSVALPPGAEWVRARAGDKPLTEYEAVSHAGGYLLRLPNQGGSAPILVEIEYTLHARFAGTPWVPLRLLDGGLITETLWEVRVPWYRAIVGVPSGWTDENEWFWDRYSWRRRPWKSPQALAAWVSGLHSSAPPEIADGEMRSDYRSYLFGRTGTPSALRLLFVWWPLLVAFSSGTVLLVGGVTILVVRPQYRLLLSVALAFGVAIAAAFQPSATFLALQSGLMGGVLLIVTSLVQRLVVRRRPSHSVFGASNRLGPPSATGSSLNRQVSAGSDDSTAIRARPASTVDHGVSAPSAAQGSESGRSPTPTLG